jgi:hypothetical protein
MLAARSKISLHSLSPSFCFPHLSPSPHKDTRAVLGVLQLFWLVGFVGVDRPAKGFCISSRAAAGDPVVRRQTAVSLLAGGFSGVRVWR